MVDHELDELRREFLEEARGKVEEMHAILEVGTASESLERLTYLAHQLKGSGGSYGYQRISDDATKLEKAVESRSGGDGAEDGVLMRYVVSLLEEIDRGVKELA